MEPPEKVRWISYVALALLLFTIQINERAHALNGDYALTPITSVATYVICNNGSHFWATHSNETITWLSDNATFTIQSAFDNLPNEGGKVFLRSGLYPIQGICITNKVNAFDYPNQEIIFEGEGKYVSTLILEDNGTGVSSQFLKDSLSAVIFAEPSAEGGSIKFTIRNIGINGNRVNQTKNIAGIVFYNDWESTVENNFLYMCGGHGIAILGGSHLRSTHIMCNTVYLTDLCGKSPSIPGSPLGRYLCGIVTWKQDVTIYDNIVGWTGDPSTRDFRGIGICGSTSSRIQRNWVWGHRYGVVVTNGFFYTVSNNFLDTCRDVGIFLYSAHCGSVVANDVRVGFHEETGGHSEACIQLDGNSSFNSIKTNKCWVHENYTSNYGIREKGAADHNVISGNDILEEPQIFYGGSIVNEIGTILNPISTVGSHTIVEDNYGFYQETEDNTSGVWLNLPIAFAIVGFGLLIAYSLYKRKIKMEKIADQQKTNTG